MGEKFLHTDLTFLNEQILHLSYLCERSHEKEALAISAIKLFFHFCYYISLLHDTHWQIILIINFLRTSHLDSKFLCKQRWYFSYDSEGGIKGPSQNSIKLSNVLCCSLPVQEQGLHWSWQELGADVWVGPRKANIAPCQCVEQGAGQESHIYLISLFLSTLCTSVHKWPHLQRAAFMCSYSDLHLTSYDVLAFN